MTRVRCFSLTSLLTSALLVACAGPFAIRAHAEEPKPVEWHLEQPQPPPSSSGETGSGTKIALGHVGDVEFWEPNRGVLITNGSGDTIPAGVWVYNGKEWHELAKVCGATNGRIAWAGPEEFWTVSDGHRGQAPNSKGLLPPIEDNSLCQFAPDSGEEGHEKVIASYAKLGFQANSYEPMDAAVCVEAHDCWFGGAALPEGQVGAFHLHWNGSSLVEEGDTHFNAVQSMAVFGGKLYESSGDPLTFNGEGRPQVLSEITPEALFVPFQLEDSAEQHLPAYAKETAPEGLAPLELSADEGWLWAAAGPSKEKSGELTVLREPSESTHWSQALGPAETNEGNGVSLKAVPAKLAGYVVTSIAAEPGTKSVWIALDTQEDVKSPSPTVTALVLHVQSNGSITSNEMKEEDEELPTKKERDEGVGPKGGAARITCPAQNDCWLATTEGWLFHLSEKGSEHLTEDPSPAFKGPLITVRPKDEGEPQTPSDSLPKESGLEESHATSTAALKVEAEPQHFASVTVPLLSHVHSRLIHGSTLELSFHLAVEARVKLVAKRKRTVVASTPSRTLGAGNRSVRLKLNPKRWPTKLALQTKALAPLPTISSRSSSVESVSTSLAFPNKALALLTSGSSF